MRRALLFAVAALGGLLLLGCGEPEPERGSSGGPPVREDGGVALAWRFRPGETLRYLVIHHTKAVGRSHPPIRVGDVETALPDEFAVERTVELDVRLDVVSVRKDGVATVGARFEAVRFRMAGSLGDLAYDSADPRAGEGASGGGALGEALRAGLASLLERSLSIDIEPSGRVASARTDVFVSYDPWREPASAAHDLAGGFGLLPVGPARPGATWTGTRGCETALGSVALDDAYTLARIGEPDAPHLARIEARTQGRLEPLAGGFEQVEIGGGETADFDAAAGRLRRSERRLTIELAKPLLLGAAASDRPFVRTEAVRTVELRP